MSDNKLLAEAKKELGEARKIIRASSARQLVKDWDRRATDLLGRLERRLAEKGAAGAQVERRHTKAQEEAALERAVNAAIEEFGLERFALSLISKKVTLAVDLMKARQQSGASAAGNS